MDEVEGGEGLPQFVFEVVGFVGGDAFFVGEGGLEADEVLDVGRVV